MVTGVWSKRIAEANEKRGQDQGFAMAMGSLVLVAVCGLGFKYKVQVLRDFSKELIWHVHGQRVVGAREGLRRGQRGRGFDPKHGFGPRDAGFAEAERDARQAHARYRARERARRDAQARSNGEETLERHRNLLGVSRGASKSELKAAYYAAAKQHHPDANDRANSERFAQVKTAYDVLRNQAG